MRAEEESMSIEDKKNTAPLDGEKNCSVEEEAAAVQQGTGEGNAGSVPASAEGTQKPRRGIFAVKIFRYRLLPLLLLCIIMSFVGFVVENLFRLFRDGVINSRRQILPFLFAYGIAVFAMYVLIGTPKEMRFFCWRIFKKESKLSATAKHICYFLILFAFIFFGEILFGTFVEWVSGVVLWDYTGIPLTFTKYTSVPTALGLSVGVMLFMRFIFEPLMKKLEKIPDKVLLGLAIGLGVPIFLDWLLMLIMMFGFGISKNWWSIQIW